MLIYQFLFELFFLRNFLKDISNGQFECLVCNRKARMKWPVQIVCQTDPMSLIKDDPNNILCLSPTCLICHLDVLWSGYSALFWIFLAPAFIMGPNNIWYLTFNSLLDMSLVSFISSKLYTFQKNKKFLESFLIKKQGTKSTHQPHTKFSMGVSSPQNKSLSAHLQILWADSLQFLDNHESFTAYLANKERHKSISPASLQSGLPLASLHAFTNRASSYWNNALVQPLPRAHLQSCWRDCISISRTESTLTCPATAAIWTLPCHLVRVLPSFPCCLSTMRPWLFTSIPEWGS